MYGTSAGGFCCRLCCVIICLFGWSASSLAEAAGPGDTEDLMDLSLVELLGLEVTSFSRQAQLLSDTPAAMFVISQADITRSGARTIPDLLRMVPGLQVAQVDASTWAVTARGSNGVFANKLLVLQDGRSMYSPLYSGVYWDTNDTDLNSIERIEVIRGPGATMWGSNAVNGVINIITKNAGETQGGQLDAVAGSVRSEGTLRYGGTAGDVNFRVFGKYFKRDGFSDSLIGGDAPDDWDMLRGGARVDWDYSDDSTLTFSGEVYEGKIGESIVTPTIDPPDYVSFVEEKRDVSGAFGLLAWDRQLSATSALKLQTYYEHTDIDNIAPEESRDTFDIDLQHFFTVGSRNAVVWGLGYRNSEDETAGDFTISLDPSSRTQEIYSGFIQDEISLVEEQLSLIVGTKVSKNNFSENNLEWEPNVRLSWKVTGSHLLWSSVARAVRIPSRVEQNGIIHGDVTPPFTPPDPGNPLSGNPYSLPLVFTIRGTPELETEEVTAYELGYRGQLSDNVQTDISLFYNQYENLRTLTPPLSPGVCRDSGDPPGFVPPSCGFTNDTHVELPLFMVNGDDLDSYGAEFNIGWNATEVLYLQGAYTYLHVDDDGLDAVASAGADNPEHQLSARSLWNVTASTKIDLWLRYVDELESQNIPSYVTLDAKLSWMPTDSLELSLVGRNLLEDEHAEFVEEYGATIATEIPREAYVQLDWHF